VKDPVTYYAIAFFIAFINSLACGQRLLDKNSLFREKLVSVFLYCLMLIILFAFPVLFGIRTVLLAAGLAAGYLHFFHDRSILTR